MLRMPGQTLSQVRALLAAAGLRPRKRYGQHFLIDLNLMRKLVAAANLQPTDVVLEIGCGTGSLTEMLLETAARVVAVEIDRGFCRIVQQRLAQNPRLTLINADVLAGKHAFNPRVIAALKANAPEPTGRYVMVSNLPYQVATTVLAEALLCQPRLECLVCTVQKEVAGRLLARAGQEDYGPLAVIADTLTQARQLSTIPPDAFWPSPQIESVILHLLPLPPEKIAVPNPRAFAQFVRHVFTHRRKMLRAATAPNGRPLAPTLELLGISPRARPEELTPDQWRRLFQSIQNPSNQEPEARSQTEQNPDSSHPYGRHSNRT
jgi:16S rRNA (adenine1518-N6/adenine1519-N6)-dimethyltransferase